MTSAGKPGGNAPERVGRPRGGGGKSGSRLLRQVEEALTEVGLAPGGSLVIGVSGGADSLALVHLLWRLREPLHLTLYAAHMDHGIRGSEGEEDARFVQSMLRGLRIPVFVRRAKLGSHASEAQARHARHRFFAQLSRELHADAVALGHTADDQAETVLLHLIRGAGVAGLAGMEASTTLTVEECRLHLCRPLLETRREEIRAYCEQVGLYPREDSTNRSPEFLRNRVRLELLPAMEEYNPEIKSALQRLSRSAARQEDFLNREVERAWPRVVEEAEWGIGLSREAFAELHPAVRVALLRRAYARLRDGSPQGLESFHVESMLQHMNGPAGHSIHLPGGVTFLMQHLQGVLTRDPKRLGYLADLRGTHPLKVPGSVRVWGWTVTADFVSAQAAREEAEKLQREDPRAKEHEEGVYEAYLDADRVGTHLWLRTRLQGDRFHPLGMDQEKRVQDFMVDAHVPRQQRDKVPLLVSEQGIAWVVGYRIAGWVSVTPGTRRGLHLTFRPTQPRKR